MIRLIDLLMYRSCLFIVLVICLALGGGGWFWYQYKGGREVIDPIVGWVIPNWRKPSGKTEGGFTLPKLPDFGSKRRIWTDVKGREMEGELITGDQNECLVRVLPSQHVYRIKLATLSAADQDYVRNAKNKWAMPASKRGQWPRGFDGRNLARNAVFPGGSDKVEIGNFIIHGSKSSKTDISTVANVCLSIDHAVQSVPLPLNWGRAQNKQRHVYLHASDAAYLSAGGPKGSGGFYSTTSHKVHISAEALKGLDLGRELGRFKLAERKDYTLLTHELVHQATPALCQSIAPAWVAEGLAEYFSSTQPVPGKFEFRNTLPRIRAYISNMPIDSDGLIQIKSLDLWPLNSFINRNLGEWNRTSAKKGTSGLIQYAEALVLVDFFVHSDNNSLRPYLEAIMTGASNQEAVDAHLLRNQTFEQIEKRIIDRWKTGGIKITFKNNPSFSIGDFRYGVGVGR